ncbi:hypothetical protein B0H10DRAFT_1787728 [Mycena sp. CBHHK59/15]|nr:hypothetical protein B0H10DRAFT_1787728 [Mycena sp. CBHHK59/15]
MHTQPRHARSKHFSIVTPLCAEVWCSSLEAANLLAEFSDVIDGITNSFSHGISSPLTRTRIFLNHPSALEHSEFLDKLIDKDIANR